MVFRSLLLLPLSLALACAQETPREYLESLEAEELSEARAAAAPGRPVDCEHLGTPHLCHAESTCRWVDGFGCAGRRCAGYGSEESCSAKGTGCRWSEKAVDDLGVTAPACVTVGAGDGTAEVDTSEKAGGGGGGDGEKAATLIVKK